MLSDFKPSHVEAGDDIKRGRVPASPQTPQSRFVSPAQSANKSTNQWSPTSSSLVGEDSPLFRRELGEPKKFVRESMIEKELKKACRAAGLANIKRRCVDTLQLGTVEYLSRCIMELIDVSKVSR